MEPDFDRLHEIDAELDELERTGRLTRGEFERLFADAKRAVSGRTDLLASLLRSGFMAGVVDPPGPLR